ncbi:MAG TPA: hypothetical protein VNY36_03440 [Bacteroidia bacterium]|nr:hypothetical protein [Bacteroidia bacterium]
MKGEKEFLLHDGHVAVEGGGVYKDHEYLIVLNSLGHRCGYVALKPEHEYSKPKYYYDDLDIECHGGLTFMSAQHSLKELLPVVCNDVWIGFDCGHCTDLSDTEAYKKYYGEEVAKSKEDFFKMDEYRFEHSSMKTFEYVEQECHKIIDQLVAA